MMAEVWSKLWSWGLVKILRLKFDRDFEGAFWWSLIKMSYDLKQWWEHSTCGFFGNDLFLSGIPGKYHSPYNQGCQRNLLTFWGFPLSETFSFLIEKKTRFVILQFQSSIIFTFQRGAQERPVLVFMKYNYILVLTAWNACFLDMSKVQIYIIWCFDMSSFYFQE